MKLLALALAALAVAGPAAAADREVYFGDAFPLAAGADPGPFDRLSDGRVACLTDECAGRTVTVAGVTIRVLPRVTAKEVAAPKPAYRVQTGLPAGDGVQAASIVLFGAAALLALVAAGLAVAELRRRHGPEPVDRLRRALQLVRESAARPPDDRRRALDHLSDVLAGAPPAEQATRLAWARPVPEPDSTRAIADEAAS